MHFARSIIIAAVALAASASASAAADTDTAAPGVDGRPFYLKTQVVGAAQAGFDSLYVFAYHTGAGLNDAMLALQQSVGIPAVARPGTAAVDAGAAGARAYFSVLFTLGSTPYELAPMGDTTPAYPGLKRVAINVGAPPPTATSAFFFEDNALQWTDAAGSPTRGSFHGWLACMSAHKDARNATAQGVQLFYRASAAGSTPGACANIQLVPVYAS